tara:strand:- start:1095 stop:1535 length:441 start_codon:yes stop_codon:yes gene_type:complete
MQLALAGIGFVGKLAEGSAKQREYNEKAAQEKLRGNSEALAYKQQGVAALTRLNETLATIINNAAFGGVDPMSGSAKTIQNTAMAEGIREFNLAQDNAILALGQATHQAAIYKGAGQTARTTSYLGAAETAVDYGIRAHSVGKIII